MAAALIPILAPIGMELINLIVGLVHQRAPVAEQQLGAGTGAAKFGQVFGDVIAALNKAAVAGQINKALPPDETIQVIIQAALAGMKLSGLLSGDPFPGAAGPLSSQAISLKPGQSLLVTA